MIVTRGSCPTLYTTDQDTVGELLPEVCPLSPQVDPPPPCGSPWTLFERYLGGCGFLTPSDGSQPWWFRGQWAIPQVRCTSRQVLEPVNTIGCGDAMTAGVLFALATGQTTEEAVALGHRCAKQNAQHLRPGVIQP